MIKYVLCNWYYLCISAVHCDGIYWNYKLVDQKSTIQHCGYISNNKDTYKSFPCYYMHNIINCACCDAIEHRKLYKQLGNLHYLLINRKMSRYIFCVICLRTPYTCILMFSCVICCLATGIYTLHVVEIGCSW